MSQQKWRNQLVSCRFRLEPKTIRTFEPLHQRSVPEIPRKMATRQVPRILLDNGDIFMNDKIIAFPHCARAGRLVSSWRACFVGYRLLQRIILVCLLSCSKVDPRPTFRKVQSLLHFRPCLKCPVILDCKHSQRVLTSECFSNWWLLFNRKATCQRTITDSASLEVLKGNQNKANHFRSRGPIPILRILQVL